MLEKSFIFDKFYRGTGQRYQVHGTGMGLAIAKAIVEAHGGTISVTSQVGHGSVFSFELAAAASTVWRHRYSLIPARNVERLSAAISFSIARYGLLRERSDSRSCNMCHHRDVAGFDSAMCRLLF